MPYGYTNEYGERVIEDPHAIANLTWANIVPAPPKQGWECTKCFNNKMKLLPINKDVPAEYWICDNCQNKISIQQRDQVFEGSRQAIQERYLLKDFSYDRENSRWSIVSGEWTSEYGTRLDAKRRIISKASRDDIIDEVLEVIEDTLKIQVNSVTDYFRE